ncbi:MAG: nucleotidyltransferase family protein [Candidatus Entotheonellia bacterium]
MGWHRLRLSDADISPAARQLQQAYRFHTIREALHERTLQAVVAALRSMGVDPILIKGWALARLYPEPGLRAYGDHDIVVWPEQHATALSVLANLKIEECYVDLHSGFGRMADQPLAALYARSQMVRLADIDIRVLGPEDHLVLLVRHFLRHNAWRPLWLCDIAAALESRPAAFDWDRCLDGSRRRADWIACTLGLAHQLLDARVDDTPVAHRAKHLPTWFVPAVLRQWDRCTMPGYGGNVVSYVASHWRDPRQILKEARMRWDMPIAATVALGGPLNEFPRIPFQLGLALAHIPGWCCEVGRYLRPQRRSQTARQSHASNGPISRQHGW